MRWRAPWSASSRSWPARTRRASRCPPGRASVLVERTSFDRDDVAVGARRRHLPRRPDELRRRGLRRAGSDRSATLAPCASRSPASASSDLTGWRYRSLLAGPLRGALRHPPPGDARPGGPGGDAPGGEIPDFDPRPSWRSAAARRMGRFAQLAVGASVLALADAGLGEFGAGAHRHHRAHGRGGHHRGRPRAAGAGRTRRPHRAALRAAAVGQHGRGQRRDPPGRHRARHRRRRRVRGRRDRRRRGLPPAAPAARSTSCSRAPPTRP